eukprot:GHRQ01023282.1.p2 GENE.GHRQ01023282.1~~GHRQ01023282.1.p2  ORF type:complete len:102 (+),score=14.19 GHRQ01023282.1:1447-1752(+)
MQLSLCIRRAAAQLQLQLPRHRNAVFFWVCLAYLRCCHRSALCDLLSQLWQPQLEAFSFAESQASGSPVEVVTCKLTAAGFVDDPAIAVLFMYSCKAAPSI